MTTVYWAGGEDVSFGSINYGMVATGYRTNFARGSVKVDLNGGQPSTTYPLTYYAATPQWGPLGQFWSHVQFGTSNGSIDATYSNGIITVWLDAGGTARLVLRGTGTNGQIKIAKVNAAGTYTDLATSAPGALNFSFPNGNPSPLDVFINYNTLGRVTVYWNGSVICDTGANVDVTTDGNLSLGAFVLGALNGAANGFWSEGIIQDTTTLSLSLQTLPPVATGNTQTWTGNVSNINALSVNYANYNYTASAAQLSEWTVSTSLPTGSWNIVAIVQAAAINTGLSAPQHMQFDVRTAAGVSYQGGTITLSNGTAFYQSVWMQNPNTATAWQPGDLINSGIKSLA